MLILPAAWEVENMSRVELKHIDKFYGTNHVLKDLNLTIEDGEFMTLLGPSGCGKTTTLRVIAGLEKPQSGFIHLDDKEIVNAAELFFADPSKRELNLVFQSYALWPHMTVYNNVAFGLTVKRVPKAKIRERVEKALECLQILEFINRYPSELSGGQQQRVAIARAIVSEPGLLLLDEPLSNLDAKLRIDMRSELKRLHQEMGTTMVYVTHDQIEALTLSTRIAIFFDGVLTQVDTPINIYTNPINLKVANFIGNPSINFIDATARFSNGILKVKSRLGEFAYTKEDFTEEPIPENEFECVLGIRPEQVTINRNVDKADCKAAIYATQLAGSETLVQTQVDNIKLLVKCLGIVQYAHNQQVGLDFSPERFNVFSKDTGNLIKRARLESEEEN